MFDGFCMLLGLWLLGWLKDVKRVQPLEATIERMAQGFCQD
jgi:hypothetical protein